MRRRRGVSLIEVAVGIALLALVVLWTTTVWVNAGRNVATQDQLDTAQRLAEQQMEGLKPTKTRAELDNLLTGVRSFSADPADYRFPYRYQYVLQTAAPSGLVYRWEIAVQVWHVSAPSIVTKLSCSFLRDSNDNDIGN